MFGEVLVEIMRPDVQIPLSQPGVFRGPFASGAPAIAAAAAARLGADVAFAGVVGDDAFGRLCLDRLRENGVRVEHVRVDCGRMTGVAFVSYEASGDRTFLFHVRDAAAGQLVPADMTWMKEVTVDWLHVSGSSLAMSDGMRNAALQALEHARSQGAKVAFDPNVRPEIMPASQLRELLHPLVMAADVILPSGEEASMLVGIDDPTVACRTLAMSTGATVILKDGSLGARIFDQMSGLDGVRVPPAMSRPADPTGAGDVFGAAYAVATLAGQVPFEAVRYAHAVAACAIETFGPMEGLPSLETVKARMLA